jgi:RNA polymerase sigma factor (sigma-70 family)
MPGWPATRVTLLSRIRDPRDQEAWHEFMALYTPLVYGFIRKRLLQDEDARDVMQEVFAAVARGTYDRRKGPFHKWLLTVILNEIRDFFAQRHRRLAVVGDSCLEEHPAKVAEEWERDHKQRLFDRVAELVRAETNPALWEAFWLTAVEGLSGKEAARTLGMTPSTVFSAKSRILTKIRERVKLLEEE